MRRRKARPYTASGQVRLTADTTEEIAKPKKLSYKEERELEALPARIEALEAEQRELHARVATADFYKEGGEAIAAALARAEAIEKGLGAAYARWEELDSRREPRSG